MATYIPKGSKGVVVKDRYGNQTIKVVSNNTKIETPKKYGLTTKEALSRQKNNNSSSSSSNSSKTLTKTQYRDINSMTPQEAREKGYKYSGAVGWYKVGTEEKESYKRIESAPPTPPKYKTEIIKKGSISQQQSKDAGFQLSGATGELMRTPATNENIDKSRQYLRDLNRYYDKQIRIETNRPAGTSNNFIYELGGQTVTRTQYIKSLRDAKSDIIKNQKQTLNSLNQPTPQQKQKNDIKIQLPIYNLAKNEINSLIPINPNHPNDSTRTDIQFQRADIFTREQQIDRDVSRAVIDNSNPINRLGVRLATIGSYKGKMYLGSLLGESWAGQKLGLKGSNKAGHIKTHEDIESDYFTEIRKRTARETELNEMLSGKKPLTAPTEFLKPELRNIKRAERDMYLKNMISNPLTQATTIALTPTLIGASPFLSAVASNPGVLMGTAFLGAKEVARVKSEYSAGNYASALGEVATVGTGLLGGGAIAGVKFATHKTTTLQHISSVEKVNTYGNKGIKVGKGHAKYDLTLNDRSNLDKLFSLRGKTRHETYRGKIDVLLNKNNAVMKVDIMNNKNIMKGDFINNKELNSQLVHIRHGKISPDNILSDTSKLNFKVKTPTTMSQSTTRTQLIQSSTKAKTSTTSLNRDFVVKDTFSNIKIDLLGNQKNIKFSSIRQTTIKPTDKIDLLTTLRNLKHNRGGKTTRETSILNTKAKRTTVDEVLYNLKSDGKLSLKLQDTKQSTIHKSNGQTFQSKAPNKNSVFNLGSGITKSQQLKHRPTVTSKMITANKDFHLTLTNNFNKISNLSPPKIPTPKPTARATANKILTNKRKGAYNPVSRTTTYQNNKLNIMFKDITPSHTIPKTPQAPQLTGRAGLVNQNMFKMGSQSAMRNAYLHKPAVNTANFGRIAMTSLNAISIITQNPTKEKQDRVTRIKTPTKNNPIYSPPKNQQRNNIINVNLLKVGLKNPQMPKEKTNPKIKQKNKQIQPPEAIYFNPLPRPSINIIPRIDTPTPRRIRLPGGNKKNRIIIPKKSKSKSNPGLNVIERQLKDINSII